MGNPAAQEAAWVPQPLGDISRTYKATDMRIVDGVLKLPNCSLMHAKHPLSFDGSITFTATKVMLKGKVFELKPSAGGGSSDTTRKKGG